MKYIIYLLFIVLVSCKSNDLKYFQEKQISNVCYQNWSFLTKYLHRDKDGFYTMKNLPLDEYGSMNYMDSFSIPMKRKIQENPDCFTTFTKEDIKKIFGIPTIAIDESQYGYFIRLDKNTPCPSVKITKYNKNNLTMHNSPYWACYSLFFYFDEKEYIKEISVY